MSSFTKPNQEYPFFISIGTLITLTDPIYTVFIGTFSSDMFISLPAIANCYNGYSFIIRNSTPTNGVSISINVADGTADTFNNTTGAPQSVAQNTSQKYVCDSIRSTWWQIQ